MYGAASTHRSGRGRDVAWRCAKVEWDGGCARLCSTEEMPWRLNRGLTCHGSERDAAYCESQCPIALSSAASAVEYKPNQHGLSHRRPSGAMTSIAHWPQQ
jgi:hypothetical protein